MFVSFLKKYGWLYVVGIVILVIHSRIKTLIPSELGNAIDLLNDRAPRSDIYHCALLIVLLAVLVFITQFFWRICIIGNSRRLDIELRKDYFAKLQSLPVSFFSKQRSGDLIAYAINDISAVRMMFGPVFAMSINGIVTATLSIFSMTGDIDPHMTLFALLPVPVAILALVVLGQMVQKRSRKAQDLFSKISGFVNESIMGIKVVKSFAKEENWTADYKEISDEMKQANIRLNNAGSLIGPAVSVTFAVSFTISLIYGGNLVLNGEMSVGDLVAFQSYLTLVQTPVIQLGRIINMVQRGIASYKRLNVIFKEPSIDTKEFADYNQPIKGDISCRHLNFCYPGSEKPALCDVSFDLHAGQTLGIAGTTGSGKTTLCSLLLKFYHTPRGMLFIDGVDINDIPAKAVREAVGYVAQDGFLFSSSVEDNIRFYADMLNGRTQKAAALSNIDTEIQQFEQKYETRVGERGTRLSGGQKQRISLARALYKDPQILILDDTLSAVDNITETVITGHLDGVLKNKTAIVISHRLSALQHSDLILYMQDGKVIEAGTHEQLMRKNGMYANTYRMQQERQDDHVEEE